MNGLNLENDKILDETGWRILEELQQDARLSYAELGRRVGLSSPAVMERVRRLEEAGIIEGYRTVVNLENVGLPILAFVRVANAGNREKQLQEVVKTMPEVLEAHHVIGNDCFFIKVAVPTVKHLERILGALGEYSQTTTSIVLSSPVNGRLITPVDELFAAQPTPNGKIRR